MANSLLLRNAQLLVTMDSERREIENAGVFAVDGVIKQVGKSGDLPNSADEVIDCTNQLVVPGMINTHHHMYQSLTRVVSAAQNCELFSWLKTLYPIWSGLTSDMIYISTQTAMAELLLSGCTTSSDHLYIYPNDCRLDDSIFAAKEIGMRFHACRGAMSVGESKGGLPPDAVVENENDILQDSQRLIETYHDSSNHAMLRIAIAPCSPFSVSTDLMIESAKLARDYQVGLHTHLAENIHDIAYSREKFSCTPAEYAEQLGWLGSDVWHAHCVQLDHHGINLFAKSGTGVAHCPSSNMRLASGIAPIRSMLDVGVNIALGVDGCASNDGASIVAEARQAMLLARVKDCNPAALSAREALEIATIGGAKVLGRNDIGSIAEGKSADIAIFDLSTVSYAGAGSDPLAALLFCAPNAARYNIINGKIVVRDWQLTTIDLPVVLEKHRKMSEQLINKRY